MADQTPEPQAEASSSNPPGQRRPEPASPEASDVSAGAGEAVERARRAAEVVREEVGSGEPVPLDLPDLAGNGAVAAATGLDLLNDVDLAVTIELGRTKMYIEDVLHLNEHSVVELDKAAGDPVDIYVNEQHVARGEVLVLDDSFCVRVTEIIGPLASEG